MRALELRERVELAAQDAVDDDTRADFGWRVARDRRRELREVERPVKQNGFRQLALVALSSLVWLLAPGVSAGGGQGGLRMPDPRANWGLDELEQALAVLVALDPEQLPLASGDSSEIFFQVVQVYSSRADLGGNRKEIEALRESPSLSHLYRPNAELTFGRELTEIHAAQLEWLVASSPSLSQTTRDVSSRVIIVLANPALADDERQYWVERSSAPLASAFCTLSVGDSGWVVTLLRAAAAQPGNRPIRGDLLEIAKRPGQCPPLEAEAEPSSADTIVLGDPATNSAAVGESIRIETKPYTAAEASVLGPPLTLRTFIWLKLGGPVAVVVPGQAL